MQQFGTQVIGSFFLSALLPPRDPDEATFYDIIGVDANATDEELRKAYRKLSLKLHPDKIAQRGGDSNAKEEAAAKYEKIQEAYSILIDEKKRLKYDALETPSRYHFVERGQFTDPQAVYENLTSASTKDRSRLVWLFFFAILLVLMQPILIAAKVNQTLSGGPLQSSSWFAILIPYWIFGGLFIVATFLATILVDPRDRLSLSLSGLEHLFWYIGIIFLCFKWDETWGPSVPYRKVFIPVYFAMISRWSRSFLVLEKVRKDVNRMVTMEFIETELLKGRSMEELSEEEQAEIKEAFLVVSVDPEFEAHSPDLSPEELEEEKVESSPEYESATEIYNSTFHDLGASLLFGTIFLILLTLKLDDRLNDGATWWAVFSPIWIERGYRLLLSFKNVFCGGVSGEEVVLYAESDFAVNGAADDNGQTTDTSNAVSGDTIAVSQEINAPPDSFTIENGDGSKGQPVRKDASKIGDNATKAKETMTSDEEVIDTANIEAGNMDEDEEMFMDQDTFQAFSSAYEQAEKNARQERSEACSGACVIIFQIIMFCLVVAKIESNYGNVDPNDVGFNVFWILFPFFLFFGCALCCCAMLIFGAEQDSLHPEADDTPVDPEDPQNNNEAVVIPLTPSNEEAVEIAVSPEKKPLVEEMNTIDPSSDGNMDDLD